MWLFAVLGLVLVVVIGLVVVGRETARLAGQPRPAVFELAAHSADDHLYRGAPPDFRHEATEVGEALIRAGLLGSKPSVGQRHVYLRREALPAIHGLIDRAETDSPVLDALWTRPPPRRPGG